MLRLTATAMLLSAGSTSASQQVIDAEQDLEAAIHKEVVTGDLKGAIERYRLILSRSTNDRRVAAHALLRLAQCLENLAQRKEARAAYTRVAAEYRDQSALANVARAKLATWTDAPPGPRNLQFEELGSGSVPPGWSGARSSGSAIEVHRKGCRTGAGCAVMANGPATLSQSFSAAAYKGKTVRLQAWLRVEGPEPARLWMRIDGPAAGRAAPTEICDSVGRNSSWTKYELASEISADAQNLSIGVEVAGVGQVSIDDISFEVIRKQEIDLAKQAIQNLYSRIEIAYEQGSTDEAASVAHPAATYREYPRTRSFRDWLTTLKSEDGVASLPVRMLSFRLFGSGAIAEVQADVTQSTSAGPIPAVRTYRDSWSRTPAGWTLTERVLTGGHYTLSPTDIATAKLIAADLKQLAAPLATVEAGHRFFDLAPLANAIGDAHFVALSEGFTGVREVLQMKHRLLEYLVREKGFNIVALRGDPSTIRSLDAYVKGTSRLDTAIVGTRELMDAMEWMRTHNSSHGQSPLSVRHTATPLAISSTDKVIFWDSEPAASRKNLGSQLYTLRFTLHRGELRALSVRDGECEGLGVHTISNPAGTGDSVFSAAGMPLFFLDLRLVPSLTTLGLWLAEPHLFLTFDSFWNRGSPASHLQPEILANRWDGVIFIEEGHAAKSLEGAHDAAFKSFIDNGACCRFVSGVAACPGNFGHARADVEELR